MENVNNHDSSYREAQYHLKNDDYKKAIASLIETISNNPLHADAYIDLADVYSKIGQNGQAVELLRKAIELMPDQSLAHYKVGRLLLKDDFSSAFEEFKQAVTLNPENPDALYSLADAYGQTNEIHKAIALLEKATSLEPAWAQAYYALGYYYHRASHWDAAIKNYFRCLYADNQYPRAYEILGKALKHESI